MQLGIEDVRRVLPPPKNEEPDEGCNQTLSRGHRKSSEAIRRSPRSKEAHLDPTAQSVWPTRAEGRTPRARTLRHEALATRNSHRSSNEALVVLPPKRNIAEPPNAEHAE